MGECGFGDGFEGGRLFLYKEIKENLKERRRETKGGRVKFVRGALKGGEILGGYVWWDLYEN